MGPFHVIAFLLIDTYRLVASALFAKSIVRISSMLLSHVFEFQKSGAVWARVTPYLQPTDMIIQARVPWKPYCKVRFRDLLTFRLWGLRN